MSAIPLKPDEGMIFSRGLIQKMRYPRERTHQSARHARREDKDLPSHPAALKKIGRSK